MTLIQRFDYGGAYEIMNELDLEDTDNGILINMCRSSVNFDFKTARRVFSKLSQQLKQDKRIRMIDKNLEELIKGDPAAMFSELIENTKFQIVNEEYIDFLGRVNRFKEAIYKYIFVREMSTGQRFYFTTDAMMKQSILRTLKNKYKIYYSNVNYAVSTYINKYMREDYKALEVDKLLSTEKFDNLLEMRHESIVGHGFMGVSVQDIYRIYGNPYNVLDDLEDSVEMLGIKLFKMKYATINSIIYDNFQKDGENGGQIYKELTNGENGLVENEKVN